MLPFPFSGVRVIQYHCAVSIEVAKAVRGR
jgi:hypothetical protein